MRTRTRGWIGLLVWAGVLSGVSSVGSATLINRMTFTQEYTFVNPCNGEEVLLSGVIHIVDVYVADRNPLSANDVHHEVLTATEHYTGLGSDGNTYLLAGAGHDVVALSTEGRGYCFDAECVVSVGTTGVLLTQGPGLNFRVHTLDHVTYTFGGTVTSIVTEYTEECLSQGPPSPPPEPRNP